MHINQHLKYERLNYVENITYGGSFSLGIENIAENGKLWYTIEYSNGLKNLPDNYYWFEVEDDMITVIWIIMKFLIILYNA